MRLPTRLDLRLSTQSLLLILLTSALILLAVPAAATRVPGETWTVGSDMACDFTSLEDALFAAALNDLVEVNRDEIHLARNLTYEGEYSILNHSVYLRGGYDDCADTTSSGKTTIRRALGERAMTIAHTGGDREHILLQDLEFERPATGTPSVIDEGGLLWIGGDIDVTLTDVYLKHGLAVEGGAVYATGSEAILRLFSATTLLLNEATRGGGIACFDGATVAALGASSIAANLAYHGGGVYLDGCELNVTSGALYGGGSYAGIVANEATDGGGAFVRNHGVLDLAGSSLSRNDATRGGGVFLTGVGSEVRGDVARIRENDAVTFGGGVYAEMGARFWMRRGAGALCGGEDECAVLDENTAGAATGGGAIYLDSGATASIAQAFVADNESARGAVAVVADDSQLTLENSVVVGNVGDVLVVTEDSATFTGAFLTVADNHPETVGTTWSFHTNESIGITRLYSSILFDDDGRVYLSASPAASNIWDCLLVDAGTDNPGSASAISYGDPRWRDPADRDFRLRLDSPAIDFCDALKYVPTSADRRGETRGYDHPDVIDVLGTYDLGAFESTLLFADGFESGDLAGWSDSVP